VLLFKIHFRLKMKSNFKTHYLRMIALSDDSLLIQGQIFFLYFQSNKAKAKTLGTKFTIA
jgi:hypothetical protein